MAVLPASSELRVVSVVDAPWDDVRTVFGTRGDPAGCWCQWFKVDAAAWKAKDHAAAFERALCEQVDAARELAEERRVDYLELRSERPLSPAVAPGLLTKDLYVTFRADLREDEEALLRRMERKRRQMMSYAARAGFTYRVAGAEELPLFYRLFAQTMHHHGTPVYPRRFLARLLGEHPRETNLFFVEQDGRPLAATLNLLAKGVLMPFYAGHELPERGKPRPRGVDDYLYLALMRWGREQGFHTFDFGRSKRETGAFDFKTHWGFESTPLCYEYFLVKAAQVPDLSPKNPKYERMISLWRKLPVPLTRLIGPPVARYLG